MLMKVEPQKHVVAFTGLSCQLDVESFILDHFSRIVVHIAFMQRILQ